MINQSLLLRAWLFCCWPCLLDPLAENSEKRNVATKYRNAAIRTNIVT